METPDPPSDTPGASKQVVLTPHDIPRSLRSQDDDLLQQLRDHVDAPMAERFRIAKENGAPWLGSKWNMWLPFKLIPPFTYYIWVL